MKRMTEAEFREYSLSGNLPRLILQVGLPLAVFALFNCLFVLLDAMMASHLGTIEVSTVAYMAQLRLLINAIGSGLVTGSMILVNRAYGAGDMEKASLLMNTMIRLLMCVSAFFLLMMPFVPRILRLIRAPQPFIETGTLYFRIIIASTVTNFINLVYINIEKTRGNTTRIMAVNIASMALKLVLSAWFIYVLGKGIAWIALASLITYLAFAAYSIPHLCDRKSIFCIKPRLVLQRRKDLSSRIIGISYPVSVEDSAFALGKVIVNSMASSYGAGMVGALGISNNVCGIASDFQNGFSDASSSIASQNYGAGKYRRAVETYKANLAISLSAILLALIPLALASDTLITIFATSRSGLDAAFEETISTIFAFDAISCIGVAVNGAGMDFLLGLGRTKVTLLLNFLKIFVFRIPVLLLLQLVISDGAKALGIMMIASNCGAAIPTTIICIIVARKLVSAEESRNSGKMIRD